MGVDDIRKTEHADAAAGPGAPRGRDVGPQLDEGTPASDAAPGPAIDAATPAAAMTGPSGAADMPGDAGVPAVYPADTGSALAGDEGTPATDAATPQVAKPTPEEYRREGAAHSGRAGAADRAADRILAEDRQAGYLGRADQEIEKGGEERAAAQRDYARASQAERSVLERESLDLFVRAQQLEKAGDAAGASALREQADAKVAAATDKSDQAVGHLEMAQEHEASLNDLREGKNLSALCESLATGLDAVELPPELNAVKVAAVVGLKAMGTMLETLGPRGLGNTLADMVTTARAEMAKRL